MQLCFHGRGGFSWIDTYLYMPSIYRKLYIRLINEELKREEENSKKKGDNKPTNEEVLKQMREFSKYDKDNKTGLNISDKLKPKKNDKVNDFYKKK